jgi:uncharacterized cupin superfamily protein
MVINLSEARTFSHSRGVTHLSLEPESVSWPDTGVSVQIMQPGKPNARYHSEPVQEDFLVRNGECIALLDGEERDCSSVTTCTARQAQSTRLLDLAIDSAPS